jgi:hypothetical protein
LRKSRLIFSNLCHSSSYAALLAAALAARLGFRFCHPPLLAARSPASACDAGLHSPSGDWRENTGTVAKKRHPSAEKSL